MDFLEHTHQQQNTEEKQQGFELNYPDVFEDRVQVFVAAHKAGNQEHDRKTEQEGENRRYTEQGISADGADNGGQEKNRDDYIHLSDLIGAGLQRHRSGQPAGQEHRQDKHRDRGRNGQRHQCQNLYLVGQEDHQRGYVAGNQRDTTGVHGKDNQNNELQALLELEV